MIKGVSLGRRFDIKLVVLCILSGLVAASLIFASKDVFGSSFSWTGSGLLQAGTVDKSATVANCQNRQMKIGGVSNTLRTVCVYNGQGFRYGTANYNGSSKFLISLGSDSQLYEVKNVNINSGFILTPDSPHMVRFYNNPNSSWSEYLSVIENFISQFIKKQDTYNFETYYDLKSGASRKLLVKASDGNNATMKAVAPSDNSKWLVVEVMPMGLVRVNLEDFTIKWFDKGLTGNSSGIYRKYQFDIADDGKYIAAVGDNVVDRIVTIDYDCGLDSATTVPDNWYSGATLANPCPQKEIRDSLLQDFSGGVDFAYDPKLSYDGGQLTVTAVPSMQCFILTQ